MQWHGGIFLNYFQLNRILITWSRYCDVRTGLQSGAGGVLTHRPQSPPASRGAQLNSQCRAMKHQEKENCHIYPGYTFQSTRKTFSSLIWVDNWYLGVLVELVISPARSWTGVPPPTTTPWSTGTWPWTSSGPGWTSIRSFSYSENTLVNFSVLGDEYS